MALRETGVPVRIGLVAENKHGDVNWQLLEGPDRVWEFEARIEGRDYRIDFFNVRDEGHKPIIARRIANLESFTAHGHGINGFAQAVPIEGRDVNHYAGTFYDRKPGRVGKIPLLGTPKMIMDIIDKRVIHPDFQRLLTREYLEEFFGLTGTRHMIVPLLGEQKRIHPNFKTGPAYSSGDWKDSGLPVDHWLDHTTVSMVVLPDRDWTEIADLVTNINPRVYIGITSMNNHKEPPAYDTKEGINYFIDYVKQRGEAPFDFGIRDAVFESLNLRSSHSQVRLPFVGEDPMIYEHRGGHMTPAELAMRLNGGYPIDAYYDASGQLREMPYTKLIDVAGKHNLVKQLAGAVRAATDYRGSVNHGQLLMQGLGLAAQDYQGRH